MLLLGAAAGYNSRSWQAPMKLKLFETLSLPMCPNLVPQLSALRSEAVRTLVNVAETQLCNFASEGWFAP